MNNGYTVEPLVYTDETGQEQLSYDHAVIQDHSIRRQEYNSVTNDQEHYIYDDGRGNREHAYDYGEQGAEFDEGYQQLPDYEYESDEDEEDNFVGLDAETTEAIYEAFYENIGDEEYYDAIFEWANEYLDDEDADDFNGIMDSGDPELILRALYALSEAYEESDEDEDYDY